MDTPRMVYTVSPQNPGSDVAAETAAALAAAAIAFRNFDNPFSQKLLQTAMDVFKFADRYRGSYSTPLGSAVCPFYCSYSGFNDELLWAAAWIHRASGTPSYLNYLKNKGEEDGSNSDDFSFSWDNKRAGTKVLISKLFLTHKNGDFESYDP
ncbi:endoglucanase CX-like protein [Tanacetum coccineum]